MRKLILWGAPLALVSSMSCGQPESTQLAGLVPHQAAEAALTNGSEYLFLPQPVAKDGVLCLDVRGASDANGSILQLWGCNGSKAQLFARKGQALQVMGHLCLEMKEGQSYSGGKVQLSECQEGAPNQAWESHGRQLRLKGSKVCLDVVNGLMNQGAALQVWACDAHNENQLFVAQAQSEGNSRSATDSNTNISGRKILWEDTFEGTSIDSSKWEHDSTCDGGNSNQLQCFTSNSNNSYIEAGQLHIKVVKENFEGKEYTSARLTSVGDASFTLGRIEVRAKVPCGQGFWPAATMLPKDDVYGPWPQSGELNIMEVLGGSPDTVHGTAHFGEPSPNNRSKGGSHSMSSGSYCKDFHVYAIERSKASITWSVDNEDYYTLTPKDADFAPAAPWPFDKAFVLSLDVGMGGRWAKAPDESITSGEMIVDYVRAYAPSQQ